MTQPTEFDCVTAALNSAVEANRIYSDKFEDELSAFECVTEPGIVIIDFMRMFQHLLQPTELVRACILLDRLLERKEEFLSIFNAHRLVLVAALVSAKLSREGETGPSNREFARSTGLDLVDVNHMEMKFLSMLDWDTVVKDMEFVYACIRLPQLRERRITPGTQKIIT
eukprot:Hpha_TRINITY_DN26103_c0_g1::TRINITY_DN26103_c0_g1_i1::g.155310::m.155310